MNVGECMANTDKMIVVRGKLDWAKVTGKARPYTGNPKYNKGPYWSVDITPDAKSLKIIREAGIEDKLRTPKGNDQRKAKFLSLTVLENKADGSKNDPPRVKDGAGEDWPQGTLIGNGSIADIQIKVKDYGETVGAYYQKMRVLDLVSYEGGSDFAPLSEDDEFFGKTSKPTSAEGSSGDAEKASTAFDEELDDDIPF